MSTWHFYKQGYAIPADFFGMAALRKTVNMPDIIAQGRKGHSPLAIAGVRTAVPVTGLVAADVIQLFRVPPGTMVRSVGMRVTTANAAATTISIGCNSATQPPLLAAAAAGFMAATATNAEGVTITEVGAAQAGSDTVEGCVYITNGTSDLTTAVDVWLAGIIDFWADIVRVF